MTKYIYIALGLSILANVFGFNYFQSRLETKEVTIQSQKDTISNQKEIIETQAADITTLEGRIEVKDLDFIRIEKEFESYKTRTANIKPREIVSIRTIIEEVPADLVVVEANESSNETIRSINNSAATFKRLHN